MKNFPIEYEGKTYWISRSVAVSGFIFCLIDKKLYILISKRGSGTPNYQGYWNCPCGYLDYNETTAEACSREIAEETNLNVNPKNLFLFDFTDKPEDSESQNITFNYWTFSSIYYSGQTIYPKGTEPNEVEDVKWISIDELDNYEFAFNHKRKICQIIEFNLKNYISEETLLKIKKCIE